MQGQSFLPKPGVKGAKNSLISPDTTRRSTSDTSLLSRPSKRPSLPDSLPPSKASSPDTLPLSPNAVTDIIHYTAADSIAIRLDTRQASLHRQGTINYQQMELKADRIDVDFNQQNLHATGSYRHPDSASADTARKYVGRPYFKQNEAEYYADTIVFNYRTQRGIIHGVITQEGDGFLHGTKVKKINDSVMYLNSGQYTTCNYAHPHFALNFTHSKLILNDKIVTGPAYLSVQDIPTPLVLPFAFFPLSKGVSSGLIMPSYGWMRGRGYYLKDGGWYFALGDYMDLSLLGEVYTNLSWMATAKSNYYKRYKYKGVVDVSYGRLHEGIRGDTNTFRSFTDFKIHWKHDQDPKANPNSRFSADVNLQSQNYNKNTTNTADYFSSTTTSSVSYSTSLFNALNLSIAANESYNAKNGLMNIKLPSLSLSTNTIYPLRRRNPAGAYRWYENISLTYSLNAQNSLNEVDSNILKRSVLNKMQYGIEHSVPIKSTIKVLKYFNLTNAITANARMHWSTIRKHLDEQGSLIIDTVRGFCPNYDLGLSSSLSTRIYGMFNYKHGPIRALRHVVSPTLSFNYNPDFGNSRFGYWQQYTDSTGYVHRYSIFEQSLYGGPSDGQSGRLQFSVGNSLEMKVRKRSKEPIPSEEEQLTKVMLIESLNFSAYYDFAKDSLNLSDLSVTGRTTLFKNLVVNYSGTFTPYLVDTLGRKHNQYLWNIQSPDPIAKRFLQKTNSTWSTQLSYSLNPNTFHKDSPKSQGQAVSPLQTPFNSNPLGLMGSYVDFSVPWNLSLNYTLSYVSTYVAAQLGLKHEVVQNVSLSGNFSLTDKWRFTFSTGYDFANKGFSYTQVNIHRDLHCWEMSFNWIPFGYYKSWTFQINIKAQSLKDVKYKKNQPYQRKFD